MIAAAPQQCPKHRRALLLGDHLPGAVGIIRKRGGGFSTAAMESYPNAESRNHWRPDSLQD